jgi:hypothetical protein
MKSVLEGRRPALQVVHFPDNAWAIADSVDDPNIPRACVAQHMRHVLDLDPGLEELARLPIGYQANRSGRDALWVVTARFV